MQRQDDLDTRSNIVNLPQVSFARMGHENVSLFDDGRTMSTLYVIQLTYVECRENIEVVLCDDPTFVG